MDERIQRELQRITSHLPAYLSENLMMDDPLDVKYEQMNAELMKSKHIDENAKRAIQRSAKTQKKEKVVNTSIARQIDEWYEKEIKRAITDGRLPKPEADQWMRDRARKMKAH